MWTRRVLLATLIAAAALSLPRQVPAGGDQLLQVSQGFAIAGQR